MRTGMTMVMVAAGLVMGSGCAGKAKQEPTRFVVATPAGETADGREVRYDLDEPGKLVLLDKGVAQSVSFPSVMERRRADGRLEVIANVKNKLNRRIEVQISCVFKDATGFVSDDEAPFRTLILTENAEEAARFVSLNEQARTYTIRIRQAR